MKIRMNYSDVVKAKFDAGIYREYLVENFGDVLEFGGSSSIYFLAFKHCKTLAKILGISVDDVITDIRTDYRLAEG